MSVVSLDGTAVFCCCFTYMKPKLKQFSYFPIEYSKSTLFNSAPSKVIKYVDVKLIKNNSNPGKLLKVKDVVKRYK